MKKPIQMSGMIIALGVKKTNYIRNIKYFFARKKYTIYSRTGSVII